MENNYSNLNMQDLTLLLLVTIEQLARRTRTRDSFFTHQDGVIRSMILDDMRNIRIEIVRRARTLGKLNS